MSLRRARGAALCVHNPITAIVSTRLRARFRHRRRSSGVKEASARSGAGRSSPLSTLHACTFASAAFASRIISVLMHTTTSYGHAAGVFRRSAATRGVALLRRAAGSRRYTACATSPTPLTVQCEGSSNAIGALASHPAMIRVTITPRHSTPESCNLMVAAASSRCSRQVTVWPLAHVCALRSTVARAPSRSLAHRDACSRCARCNRKRSLHAADSLHVAG